MAQTIVVVIEQGLRKGLLHETRLVEGNFEDAKAWLERRDVYDAHIFPERWTAYDDGLCIKAIRYATGGWVDIYLMPPHPASQAISMCNGPDGPTY